MNAVSKTGTVGSRNHILRREQEKELHQLRLRFKAIRVQCLLLEFAFPERYPAKSLFISFRNYYQQTSRLRDFTVARQRFRKICLKNHIRHNGFSAWLWQGYLAEEKQMKHVSIPDIDTFERQHRNEIPTEELPGVISQQMKQLMEKIKAAHLAPEITGNLHWQRKQLKKLIYLNRLLTKDSSVWDETITARLEKLDTKLGAWHDLQVLLQFIGQFAGLHPRGHMPFWLSQITRAIVAEQIRILDSCKTTATKTPDLNKP